MMRPWVEYQVISSLYFLGKTGEARASLDSTVTQFKDTGGTLTSLTGFFFALDGDSGRAHEKIDEAIKSGSGYGHYHHTTLIFAWICAALGEFDSAMKWLEFTAENGYPNLTWFERDPNLDSCAPIRRSSRSWKDCDRVSSACAPSPWPAVRATCKSRALPGVKTCRSALDSAR